jgi:hypothetical protein
VGGSGKAGRVGERAHGVRRKRERDHFGSLADQLLHGVVVERHVIGADRRLAHHQIVVLGHEQPGRDVGVVVERCHHDLVAGRQRARHRVRKQEVQRGHVGAEGNPVRLSACELGGRGPSAIHDLHGFGGSGKGSAQVGVGVAQAAGNRVDHILGHLRAAWPVEEHGVTRERGEALSDLRQALARRGNGGGHR